MRQDSEAQATWRLHGPASSRLILLPHALDVRPANKNFQRLDVRRPPGQSVTRRCRPFGRPGDRPLRDDLRDVAGRTPARTTAQRPRRTRGTQLGGHCPPGRWGRLPRRTTTPGSSTARRSLGSAASARRLLRKCSTAVVAATITPRATARARPSAPGSAAISAGRIVRARSSGCGARSGLGDCRAPHP